MIPEVVTETGTRAIVTALKVGWGTIVPTAISGELPFESAEELEIVGCIGTRKNASSIVDCGYCVDIGRQPRFLKPEAIPTGAKE